jgi:glycosyltransferase involved in cell wall biosynthesis
MMFGACTMLEIHPKVLLFGTIPPPYHGSAVMIKALLDSVLINQRFNLIFQDISDRRDISNIGRWDLCNIWQAFKHGFEFLLKLLYHRPDVVYVPIASGMPGFLRDCLFVFPGILARRKLIIHFHTSSFGDFYDTASIPIKWCIRYILTHTTRAIVLGESLRGIVRGLVQERRIAVIPNGLDPALFVRSVVQVRQPDREFRVLYLGNLMEEKGYWTVLEAALIVARQEPHVHFSIAGPFYRLDGERRSLAFVKSHGLEDIVSFTGMVSGENKAKLLLDSDLFVFPPIAKEGQPLVLLEAMAAGLPIITTDQGAIRETVVDGENSFVVPAGDADAIAEKIILLLRYESLRLKMVQASRERFFSHYMLERWEEDMARVFQEAHDT